MVQWLWTFLLETWNVVYEAAPFLLFGFLAAGALHYWVPAKRIYQLLGQRKFSSILLASLVGIPLPLCSCSVIPTAVALRRRGASKGATVSFLISTPETGVESIALTYALIDLPMTIFRPLAALITALFAGLATEVFGGEEEQGNQEGLPEVEAECEACKREAEQSSSEIPQPHPEHVHSLDKPKPASYWASFSEIFDDISYWLLLGLVLAGFIGAVIPENLLEDYLGKGILPMLAALVISVPLYVCASSSTPIAAALMMKGLSPGAALVFLLAGPATNIATIVVLWKFLGRRILLIYLISIILISMLLGLYIDSYYEYRQIDPKMVVAQSLAWIPDWFKWACVIGFIGLLANSMRRTAVPREMVALANWMGIRGLSLRKSPAWVKGLLIVAVLFAYLWSGVLIVRPGESGIVKRFGKIVQQDLDEGFHLHWPYPIETSEVCEQSKVRLLKIGFTQELKVGQALETLLSASDRTSKFEARTEMMPVQTIEAEAYYLTGDQNEIDIQSEVEYRISDPVQYLYGLEEPDRIVRNHTISVLMDIIGRNKIDEVYTFLRNEVEQEATQRLQTILNEQQTGIEFLNLYLVSVHAPPEVHEAFRDLASAREDRSRSINDAQGEKARIVFSASGEASEKISEARAQYQEMVSLGEGDSEAYLKVLKQYELNPETMTSRLWFETQERVLPQARLYLGLDRSKLGFWRWETGTAETSDEKPQQKELERLPTLDEILAR